ncbi:MAG: hypothetical protein AB8F34_06050, partial [Akkermansiaceae bacterium]
MKTLNNVSFAIFTWAILLGLALITPLSAGKVVLDNGGLKNTYRLIFTEISPKQKFVNGALEILGDEDDRQKPHTRITFTGSIHPVGEGGAGETLKLHTNPLVAFYPPSDTAQPSPAVTGTLYGRGTDTPGATLRLWSFDLKLNKWQTTEMNFGTVPETESGGDEWLSKESLGGISLGMTEAAVRKIITSKITYGETNFEGATGLTVQDWTAKDLGIELKMGGGSPKAKKLVESVTIFGKSKGKSARGIGIGATRAELMKLYGKEIREGEDKSGDKNLLVAGSVFGGMLFTIGDSGK